MSGRTDGGRDRDIATAYASGLTLIGCAGKFGAGRKAVRGALKRTGTPLRRPGTPRKPAAGGAAGAGTEEAARGPGVSASAARALAADFAPYAYGATLGCPSKGRPEKVLARLKTTTTIWQEDEVGIRPDPGSQPRNGRPLGGGYVYQGTGEDTLTAWLSAKRLRREAEKAVPAAPLSLPELARRRRAVTRLPAPLPEPAPAAEPLPEPESAGSAAGARPDLQESVPVPEPEPAKRHRKCGYPFGSVGHKTVCGDA